uniref:Uncharacterized protein n=1 Tax=Romanomermis culicivorax TaxID=13658 RepID=A0A915IE17_ROMCU
MDGNHDSQNDNQSSLSAAENSLRHQQHPFIGTMLMNVAAKSDIDHNVLNLPGSVRWHLCKA